MFVAGRKTLGISSHDASLDGRIGGFPWDSEAGRSAWQHQVDIGETREASRGELVIREGVRAEHVFSVIDGAFSVEKDRSSGLPLIVGFLFARDIFGIAHGDSHACSVRATIRSSLLAMPRASFERMCERHPGIQRTMLSLASNELAAAQDHLLVLGRKSAVERIASFLIALDDRNRRQGHAPGTPLWLPMRRADIANHLGLTLETVSRTMTDLKSRGLIEPRSLREIRIRDRSGLERLTDRH